MRRRSGIVATEGAIVLRGTTDRWTALLGTQRNCVEDLETIHYILCNYIHRQYNAPNMNAQQRGLHVLVISREPRSLDYK